MAIIKGKFLYGAYYNSLSELMSDEYLEADRIVKVKDGAKETDYFITTVRGENSFQVKNGLYAVETLLGNSPSSESKKQYVRNSGIDTDLGFLKRGSIPRYTDINFLIDDVLYEGFCKVEISTNLNEGVFVRGERKTISRVVVNFSRVEVPATKIEVIIGSYMNSVEDEFTQGSIVQIPVNVTISDTEEIIVTVQNAESSVVYTKLIEFDDPVYYSMIDSAARPSSEAIKRMSRYLKVSRIEDTRSLQGTSFLIAVPITYSLVSIKDENGIPSEGIFNSYNVTITNDTLSTLYKVYYSVGLYLDNYKIIYELKKL